MEYVTPFFTTALMIYNPNKKSAFNQCSNELCFSLYLQHTDNTTLCWVEHLSLPWLSLCKQHTVCVRAKEGVAHLVELW